MPLKKKILLIGSLPPPYHGSNIYFSNLLNSDLNKEFDVIHLDTSDHRDLNNLTKLDFTNVKLALKNIYDLGKLIKKENPDLIYVPHAVSILPYLRDGLFMAYSSRLTKAKIVVHLHGGNYFRNEFYNNSNIFVKSFIKKTLKKASAAIVLGESLKPVYEDLVKNVYIVPNGTDFGLNFSNEELERKDDDRIRITFLGNLLESKGLVDVLNSARSVIQQFSNAEFSFAGAWSDYEKNTKELCLEILERDGLTDHVKFPGIVTGKDKENLLKETDVFVFPSHKEGQPLVIIEAMAAGCPVISSKGVGAIPHVVDDGKSGLLIEPGNVDQLTQAILKLCKDPALRKSMGAEGRKKFERMYTLEKNISGMKSVFEKVMESTD